MRRTLFWLPALGWAAGIYYLSSLSRVPGNTDIPDYVSHLLAYFVLALCCALGIAGRIPLPATPGVMAPAWLLASFYGLSDEVHQSFTPGRTASGRDLLFDAAGALAAVLGVWLLERFRSRNRNRV